MPIETHGDSQSKLYGIWLAMRRRCYLESSSDYKNYGGRGISVCVKWFMEYKLFKEWSLENGYEEGLTLDRINVDGNYEPSNCRWISRVEQGRNKRSTVYLDLNGETKSLQEWSDEYGLPYKTVRERYRKGTRGKELLNPLVLNKPPKSKPKTFVEINGMSKSLREWSEYSGVSLKTIEYRYYQKGLRDEKLIEKPKKKGA